MPARQSTRTLRKTVDGAAALAVSAGLIIALLHLATGHLQAAIVCRTLRNSIAIGCRFQSAPGAVLRAAEKLRCVITARVDVLQAPDRVETVIERFTKRTRNRFQLSRQIVIVTKGIRSDTVDGARLGSHS